MVIQVSLSQFNPVTVQPQGWLTVSNHQMLKNRLNLYKELIRWDKPAGTLLLLWPTLSALWLAAKGFPGWHLLTVFALGTVLMRSAGCAVNDVADRQFDRHVQRTAQRPITRGALSVSEALAVAATLALTAFLGVLTTNTLTVLCSVVALGVTLVYPYTKRFFAMPQAVLGVAFSLGIPMAFAAVQQTVPAMAGWLLLGNLFWVLAYDTEYAMVDRDDDVKLGLRTSAITLGRFDVAGVMLFYALYFGIWAVLGTQMGLGWAYFSGLAVAFGLALWHYQLIKNKTREGCFRAFRLNHWIGLAVFAGVVVDHASSG
jgi:4-hydroxybenzoate polyprenyltransferase